MLLRLRLGRAVLTASRSTRTINFSMAKQLTLDKKGGLGKATASTSGSTKTKRPRPDGTDVPPEAKKSQSAEKPYEAEALR